VARIVKQCQELPGYELFQYLDENGQQWSVESADVNEYLRAATGQDFTAKDFRTWGGTVEAVRAFYEVGPAESEKQADKNIVQAIKRVSTQLGNTATICRKYYVHPAVIEAYRDHSLFADWDEVAGQAAAEEEALRLEEKSVWSWLSYAATWNKK
jgi:DNA topoisomerase-1